MSTNSVSTPEDSEMADCDGEKVVTMMDVLQEQQEFEEDANAVLGASDDKNCTYAKGYIKRQAIYVCMTCCSDAKMDPTKRAGVCLACSLSCHENHELIELYTKRNFRCDCGNPKFNSNPCQFNPNKTDLNEDNKYNQNYSGVYCTCHRPYPDPETTIEDEMIQCIICEDWLHASHLEAIVPANDQYAEMICKDCMDKNEFLHDYNGLAVTVENVDIEVSERIIYNGNTPNSRINLNGDNENIVTEGSKGKGEGDTEMNDDVNDSNIPTELETTDPKELSSTLKETKNMNGNANEKEEINKETISSATLDVFGEITSNKGNGECENVVDNSEKETCVQESKACSDGELNNTSEKINDVMSVEGDNKETSGSFQDNDTNNEDAASEIEKHSENGDNSNLLPKNDPNSAPEESNENDEDKDSKVGTMSTTTSGHSTSDKQSIGKQENVPAEANVESINEAEDVRNNTESLENSRSENVDTVSVNTQLQDMEPKQIMDKVEINSTSEITEPEKVENNDVTIRNESESQIKNITENDETNSELTIDNVNDKETKEDEETIDPKECEITTNSKKTKRRLSIEDKADDLTVKKSKYEEKSCVRPDGVKRLSGATFWPSNFRQKLCTCNECLSMYKDLAVLFLIDPEDTVTAYETLGKERTEGNPSSQYEKGLQALSSLDRIQQINALTEYNKMRDKLVDFLRSFKDRKEIVKEEDIKAFFAGMKPKREPDGVYFCR